MTDDDKAIILCIRVGREAGPILPAAQQVPCADCGVKVWQSTFPGTHRHPVFARGQWDRITVPDDAVPVCGPCALARAKAEKDMEMHATLFEAFRHMERPDRG